jgi:hypothetical protein
MRSKSIFLLVIFLLNTVVGFACAVGMERNAHGESHVHTSSKKNNHEHNLYHKGRHVHKPSPSNGLNLSKEEACCKALVNNLVIQGKLVPQSTKIQIILPFILHQRYNYPVFIPVTILGADKSVYVVQRERPPNEDIRITIKSFQI